MTKGPEGTAPSATRGRTQWRCAGRCRIGDEQARADQSDTGRRNQCWHRFRPYLLLGTLVQTQGGNEVKDSDETEIGALWPPLFSDAERAHWIPTPVIPLPLRPDCCESNDQKEGRRPRTHMPVEPELWPVCAW